MKHTHTEALRGIGFSESEINIYLALLKKGEAKAHDIAKQTGIPRTTIYGLLNGMIAKGIASSIVKEQATYFQAVDPQVIIRSWDEKRKQFQDIVPELLAIATSMGEPASVVKYEGVQGIKSILQDMLREEKPIDHYGDLASLMNVLPYAFPSYIKERVKRKIPIRVICKEEKEHGSLLQNSKKEFRELRFVPQAYGFTSNIFIYAEKVAIMNIKHEPFTGIVITNKDFVNTQENFFALLWNKLKTQ